MLTQEEYLGAWMYYGIGAAILMVCTWFITKRITWKEPRLVVRLSVTTLLLFPWYSDTQQTYMSPAWIIAAIEGVFEGGAAFWRAGLPLVIALIAVLLLSFGMTFGARFFVKSREAKAES